LLAATERLEISTTRNMKMQRLSEPSETAKKKIHIKTSTGVNVTVFSPSTDSISLAFDDENKQREIYHTHFIQSVEARQPRDKNLIFIKTSGTYMSRLNEAEKEEKIFLYDLSTRKLIGWTKTK
jgi:siroheme synthase (precorrin-2 oxidase/ferrochelatase)